MRSNGDCVTAHATLNRQSPSELFQRRRQVSRRVCQRASAAAGPTPALGVAVYGEDSVVAGEHQALVACLWSEPAEDDCARRFEERPAIGGGA